MKFLVKIEDAINSLLLRLGAFALRLVPRIGKRFIIRWKLLQRSLLRFIKQLPSLLIAFVKTAVPTLKSWLSTVDFKAQIKASIAAVTPKTIEGQDSKWKIFKTRMCLPFYFFAQWLRDLSTAQSLMLLSFTAGSFLAGISMVTSGNRILAQQRGPERTPASIEEVVSYDRPVYYKQPRRHLDITSLRLPVYLPELNELGTVDIDFTAVLSNRQSRMFLESKEFQLRDHLILQVEPIAATFPLEEEGKVILREKLKAEINDFLSANKVEGQVLDIEITYVLAN